MGKLAVKYECSHDGIALDVDITDKSAQRELLYSVRAMFINMQVG